MEGFKKSEIIGLTLILAVVFAFSFKGILEAERKGRDAQRKADLGVISNALHLFFEDFGYFPPSEGGKIKMCKNDNFAEVLQKLKNLKNFDRELFFSGLKGCEWGKDSLLIPLDENLIYLKTIPKDPQQDLGFSYLYFSNTKRFQIYSFLEGGRNEDGFDQGILERGILCGREFCMFGKSSGDTPLDISIEEYEDFLKKISGKN